MPVESEQTYALLLRHPSLEGGTRHRPRPYYTELNVMAQAIRQPQQVSCQKKPVFQRQAESLWHLSHPLGTLSPSFVQNSSFRGGQGELSQVGLGPHIWRMAKEKLFMSCHQPALKALQSSLKKRTHRCVHLCHSNLLLSFSFFQLQMNPVFYISKLVLILIS